MKAPTPLQILKRELRCNEITLMEWKKNGVPNRGAMTSKQELGILEMHRRRIIQFKSAIKKLNKMKDHSPIIAALKEAKEFIGKLPWTEESSRLIAKLELVHDFGFEQSQVEMPLSEEMRKAFDSLYEKIKHGDQDHQDWLKNEMDEFLKTYNNEQ